MQLLLFTYCLQYICLQHLYSRWCKSHVWASCLFAFFCVSGTPSTVTLNHLFYVKPSLSALFPWWTSIRITMSRGAEARACSLYASIQCSKHRLGEISSCPRYAMEESEEIHDALIQSDMFLKHPGTSVTGVIEWWNMKLTVDFKWALGGVSFVTLIIEPRLSNVCHADVTVLASVDLRNIISAHSSTRKENDVTWTVGTICHTLFQFFHLQPPKVQILWLLVD